MTHTLRILYSDALIFPVEFIRLEQEMSESAFAKTLASFCNEMRLTFPELTPQIDRAAAQTPEAFWRSWQSHIEILGARNFEALTADRRGLIIGPVCLTTALWGELSEATQGAIWRYLRTLALEAVLELGLDSIEPAKCQVLLAIMSEERLEEGGAAAEEEAAEMLESSMEHLRPLMERLKGMMGGAVDLSGVEMPEIPEHLRNGCIARLAQDMAKQFKPEEFGIDPALLAGDNVEEILQRLAELYQRDPTLLIGGAKRVAEKIKRQVLGGSLNRDQLITEAREYVELFKEHPLFKEAVGKIQGFMGEGGLGALFGGEGGASSGAPSERLRAVQERLRRKMAARAAGGKTSAKGK
jgi:hypothetical protein